MNTTTELELIEKAAIRVGMKSLMNHGAASCVHSEGCDGVSQEHLVAFAREIALHCVAVLNIARACDGVGEECTMPREAVREADGWMPIATTPETGEFLVYMPEERAKVQAAKWHPNFKTIGNHFAFDLTKPTHWMPLPAAPIALAQTKEQQHG